MRYSKYVSPSIHIHVVCRQGVVVINECRSSVAECWWLKPEAKGLTPYGTTFPFQRSLNSNGPDYLWLHDFHQSLDLGKPHPSGSKFCDVAQFLSNSQHTHSSHLSNMHCVPYTYVRLPCTCTYNTMRARTTTHGRNDMHAVLHAVQWKLKTVVTMSQETSCLFSVKRCP